MPLGTLPNVYACRDSGKPLKTQSPERTQGNGVPASWPAPTISGFVGDDLVVKQEDLHRFMNWDSADFWQIVEASKSIH